MTGRERILFASRRKSYCSTREKISLADLPYDVKNNQRPLLGANPVSTEREISRMCKPKRFRIPSCLRTETYLEEVYMKAKLNVSIVTNG